MFPCSGGLKLSEYNTIFDIYQVLGILANTCQQFDIFKTCYIFGALCFYSLFRLKGFKENRSTLLMMDLIRIRFFTYFTLNGLNQPVTTELIIGIETLSSSKCGGSKLTINLASLLTLIRAKDAARNVRFVQITLCISKNTI